MHIGQYDEICNVFIDVGCNDDPIELFDRYEKTGRVGVDFEENVAEKERVLAFGFL